MAVSFNASEILQFAIKIEENGEEFYRLMAEKLKKKELKDVFNYLADEEVKHRKIFETMASRVQHYEPPESYPGEYFAYLNAYADEYVFTPLERKPRPVR
jgi:rubrerythrin